jgi:hypothetical protein
MSTLSEVQAFLLDFKAKLGVWGVVFRDGRGKNTQTLLDLEITRVYREKVLRELVATDYSEGPFHAAERPMDYALKNRL